MNGRLLDDDGDVRRAAVEALAHVTEKGDKKLGLTHVQQYATRACTTLYK